MRPSYPPQSVALDESGVVSKARTTLEMRWRTLAIGCALSLAAGAVLMSRFWTPSAVLSWLTGAGLVTTAILAYARWHLDENRRDVHSPRLEAFGPGNVVTLVRGLALAMAGGFLFAPAPEEVLRWTPPILYTTAIVADLFDGALARRANFSTLLGARLDIELDGLGVLLAVLLAVHLGQLPPWFIPVGLARPLFSFGLWVRTRRELVTRDLPPSRHRKLFAGIQMGFLSAALWPVLSKETLTLVGACVLLPTLVGFTRDWLVVSGRIASASDGYAQLHRGTAVFVTKGVPLLLRLLAPAAVAWLWLSEPFSGSVIIASTMVLGVTAVLVGWLGRLGAVMLIISVGIHATVHGLALVTALVLVGAAMILLFGTGPMSLWKPEEAYVLADVRQEA